MSVWKIDPEGRLTELTPDGAGADVWAPSEEIGFHRAELPPGRQKMWEQTVAFVLEEQVAGPVEDQHFAVGRDGDDQGRAPVAVVSMERMQAWADAWTERGLKPRAVWPDVLAVPFEDGKPALWHENGRCLLRLDARSGLAGTPGWIHSLLQAVGEPVKMRIFSDDAASLPEAWRERAEALPCGLDERMRAGADPEAAEMNLLQGAFRTVSPLAKWGRPWAWAVAAAVAAFSFYVAAVTVEVRLIGETTAALRQASVELHRKHFPEQPPGGNLRLQVERRMAQIKGGVVKREASPWQSLVRVEPLISSCKACRVEEARLEAASVSLVVSSSAGFDELLKKVKRLTGVRVDAQTLPDVKKRKQLRLDLSLEKPA